MSCKLLCLQVRLNAKAKSPDILKLIYVLQLLRKLFIAVLIALTRPVKMALTVLNL